MTNKPSDKKVAPAADALKKKGGAKVPPAGAATPRPGLDSATPDPSEKPPENSLGVRIVAV